MKKNTVRKDFFKESCRDYLLGFNQNNAAETNAKQWFFSLDWWKDIFIIGKKIFFVNILLARPLNIQIENNVENVPFKK